MTKRSDSLSTKRLCVITLTRIFLLTHNHQSLVREITTPALASFVASCTNLAQGTEISGALRLVILQGLCELIGLHTTLFRPFLGQLQKLTLLLIAPTPSEASLENRISPVSTPVADSARRLFVLLHVCSPKNTAGDEWTQSFQSTLATAQRTADSVFRAIVEERKVSPGMNIAGNINLIHELVNDRKPGPLNLPSWTGIYAGIERLDGLLRTLQAFVATKTSVSVVFPVSSTMELADRVLSACRPSNTQDSRIRPEVGRDERDGLAAGLPQLHLSAMNLFSVMLLRMGSASAALVQSAIEQIFWVLDDENEVDEIRLAAYRILAHVLTKFGPSIPRSFAKSIARCLVLACEDIKPLQDNLAQGGEASIMREKQPGHEASTMNADSYLKRVKIQHEVSSGPSVVQAAARELMPLALARLPDGFLSEVVRIKIDSTSIVMNHRETMLASVMRTGTNKRGQRMTTSILPLLARAHSGDLGVEALLRPQLPILQPRWTEQGIMNNEDEGLYGHPNRPEDKLSGVHQDNSSIDNRRKTPTKPKDEIMQVSSGPQEHEVVAKKVEAPSVIQVIPRHLLDSEVAISYNPSKRTWQDHATSDQTGGSDISTGGSTKPKEVETPGKRARLTRDHLEHVLAPLEGSTATLSTASPVVGPRISEDAVPKSSISEAVDAAGAQFDLQQGSDDESDFEMPTLHLDLDSDEEGDEEEDEEVEEEEDNGI